MNMQSYLFLFTRLPSVQTLHVGVTIKLQVEVYFVDVISVNSVLQNGYEPAITNNNQKIFGEPWQKIISHTHF